MKFEGRGAEELQELQARGASLAALMAGMKINKVFVLMTVRSYKGYGLDHCQAAFFTHQYIRSWANAEGFELRYPFFLFAREQQAYEESRLVNLFTRVSNLWVVKTHPTTEPVDLLTAEVIRIRNDWTFHNVQFIIVADDWTEDLHIAVTAPQTRALLCGQRQDPPLGFFAAPPYCEYKPLDLVVGPPGGSTEHVLQLKEHHVSYFLSTAVERDLPFQKHADTLNSSSDSSDSSFYGLDFSLLTDTMVHYDPIVRGFSVASGWLHVQGEFITPNNLKAVLGPACEAYVDPVHLMRAVERFGLCKVIEDSEEPGLIKRVVPLQALVDMVPEDVKNDESFFM